MTPARRKSKTVKKKPAVAPKRKPVTKKPVTVKPVTKKPVTVKPVTVKPAAKKAPPKAVPAKAAKAKPAPPKVDTRSAGAGKKDVKKAAAPPVKAPAPPAKGVAAKAAPGQAPGAPNAQRAKKAPKVRPSRAREPGKRPDLPLPTPVERPGGAASQLGEKHVCFSCGAKFYDLGKPEPLCPKCGANQREAPRQVRTRVVPTPAEQKPVKRSRLLDEDEEEIVIDTDAEAPDDLDLGLGVVDDAEDFGEETVEEEEEEEAP